MCNAESSTFCSRSYFTLSCLSICMSSSVRIQLEAYDKLMLKLSIVGKRVWLKEKLNSLVLLLPTDHHHHQLYETSHAFVQHASQAYVIIINYILLPKSIWVNLDRKCLLMLVNPTEVTTPTDKMIHNCYPESVEQLLK